MTRIRAFLQRSKKAPNLVLSDLSQGLLHALGEDPGGAPAGPDVHDFVVIRDVLVYKS